MFRIFLFLGLLVSTPVFSQLTLEGVVKDDLGKPISEAKVTLGSEQNSTITNEAGMYSLSAPAGEHLLTITHVSYDYYQTTVSLTNSSKINYTIFHKNALLDEVVVSAIRLNENSPMTYSEVDKEELGQRNLGQDLPILLNYLPSVVTTSDAGAGVGYTGLRVRGSDATRVNITINGVPYNDSESQGTFWVNMPDFASSVENVQLTRGVGTSTNGTGSFGANLSLLTEGIDEKASAEIANSFGSFRTRKHTLKFNSGLLNDHFQLNGRMSKIKSDGYIERATSDLGSYFLQLAYKNDKTLIKALAFGGAEETYQAWYGIDPVTLAENRRANFAGFYTDELGEVKFYDQEVDHYNQDHYQLILNRKLNTNWSLNLTGHYTWGRGYFEQYKEDEFLADYNLMPLINGGDTISTTDLIRRRWLDNDFYGAVGSISYHGDKLNSTFGSSWNKYLGDHFGEIIWAQFSSNSEIRDRYYDDYGNKDEANVYWKNEYDFSDKLQLFADLQYRSVSYEANGVTEELLDENFGFFNPKVGLSYNTNKGLYYLSYARANREPSRTDFENGNPEPEQLDDIELGWRGKFNNNFSLNVNGYYMLYKNQLVLTGQIDEVGAAIKTNVGESFRTGIEIDASYFIKDKFMVTPNVNLSVNENVDFFTEGEMGIEELGNTQIAFSPSVIMGNRIGYSPVRNLWVSLLSKYVGEQFMGNVEAPLSKLDAYFINDVSINYAIQPKHSIKSIELSLLLNNVLDKKYISNGYWGPGFVGYYPQAGFNFLTGVNLKF